MLSPRALQAARAHELSAQHVQVPGAAPHEAPPHASAQAQAHADLTAGLVPMSEEEVQVVDEFEGVDAVGGETEVVEKRPDAGSEEAADVAPEVLQTSLRRVPHGAKGKAPPSAMARCAAAMEVEAEEDDEGQEEELMTEELRPVRAGAAAAAEEEEEEAEEEAEEEGETMATDD